MEERRIGRYRILSQHAGGGMGDVWRAQDDTLNRAVAIKLLRPERLGDGEALARFRREAQTVARLKHDHIAALYEFGDDPAQPYLAMEWVEGQSLEERLRGGRLQWAEALAIFSQLMEALDYAHAQGVVHRDIKPANLMLSGGRLTVVDFGLACLLSEPQVTETGPIFGTPLYLAPEMAAGGAVDGRADLYAAALVLFEMLAGKPAFGPGSVMQILSQQVNAPRPILSESAAGLPVALDDVLVKALDTDPGKRYADGAQLVAALRAAGREEKSGGGRAPLVLALLTLAVLGWGAWRLVSQPRPLASAVVSSPAPSPVVSPLRPAWSQPAPYGPWLVAGERVLVSAAGQLRCVEAAGGKSLWQVAQAVPPRLLVAGESQLLRWNGGGTLEGFKLSTGQQQWKLPVPGKFQSGALSSDEEFYLLGSRLLALDPGPPQQDWEIEVPALGTVAPVADEKVVVVALEGKRLGAYRYADGGRAWQVGLSGAVTRMWLAEGVLLVGTQDGQLTAYEVATGKWLWEAAPVEAAPVVALGGGDEWLVCAWKNGELACLDYEGYEAWKLQLGEEPAGFCESRGRLLVACASGRLLCLDRAKGHELWHARVGPVVGTPAWVGDRLLLPLARELSVFQVAP